VKHQETLETSTVVGEFADTVKGKVNNLLTDGVVTTGVVVGSVFLARDQLFGVEELAVGTSPNLVNDGRLKIEENGTRDVFSSTGLGEKGVEGIITSTNGLIRGHLTVRLDSVFEAVQFPTGVTDLDTSLTEMNREDFTHG